jgi:glutathione synthase/RimK-type ligase-like ATP-grasp enzyme
MIKRKELTVLINVNRLQKRLAEDLSAWHPEVLAIRSAFTQAGWKVVLGDWHELDLSTAEWSNLYYDDRGRRSSEPISLTAVADLIVARSLGSVEANINLIGKYFQVLSNFFGSSVINHPAAMMYGRDKQYLKWLGSIGVPTVSTHFFAPAVTYSEIIGEISWEPNAAIIKPVTGEAGNSVFRLDTVSEETLRWKEDKVGGWLVQPFLRNIHLGERSLIFVNGSFVYCVKKTPRGEEFLTNARWSPDYELCTPTKEELEMAEHIVSSWPLPLHTARVDLVGLPGQILVMEVETVNPSFYIGKLDLGVAKEYLLSEVLRPRYQP